MYICCCNMLIVILITFMCEFGIHQQCVNLANAVKHTTLYDLPVSYYTYLRIGLTQCLPPPLHTHTLGLSPSGGGEGDGGSQWYSGRAEAEGGWFGTGQRWCGDQCRHCEPGTGQSEQTLGASVERHPEEVRFRERRTKKWW